MRPKTKLQVQVFELSRALPKITAEQKQWALEKCLKHVAFRTKKAISCLDCGHIWTGPSVNKTLLSRLHTSCNCPSCGVKLEIQDSRNKKKLDQRHHIIAIIDVVKEFQVTRFFELNSHHKVGKKACQYLTEVVQHWFVPNGKVTVVARMAAFGYNSGFTGDLEIRPSNVSPNIGYGVDKYNIYADSIYPKVKVLPIYKRNGFTAKIKRTYPYSLFMNILTDSKVETLIKSKQFDLLATRLGSKKHLIDQYWNSIKICIRQKYIIKDAGVWLDYLELLRYFERDLRSPKYTCPKNLHQAHNQLVTKKRLVQKLKEADKMRQQIATAEPIYKLEKEKFFGLRFSDGNLTIKVLESVREFMEEGDTHHHCIFTNKYYKNKYSLCFSAQIKGVSVETIEVNIDSMKIIQSRGMQNKPSKFHDRIIELLNANLPLIKKRMVLKSSKNKISKQQGLASVA
ncbi:transcription elongation factor Elf1 [Pedobacter sp. AK013]|uniref:PcfJ domain-containing protein n=1 Tax=Pedobacter sp. AK013 TaxID=2723071 RepID=UPI00161FB43E|nr:PcfJ domain-containing protein [Pedobacter sp. AK013]MBB6236533.1 transcription elongation factor Elf1 [Pedobacter sp. AK013]